METKRFVPLQFVVAVATTMLLVLMIACEKENPASPEGEITETNLFPLAAGRIWVFSSYDLDTTNSQKISASVHREASYVQAAVNFGGKPAFRMIDSSYTPVGILQELDTSYIAVENGDLWMWFGDFPTPAWQIFFKRSAGINQEYSITQWQEVHDGVTVNVSFKGTIYAKEAVALQQGTIQAYKLELKVNVSVAGTSYETLQYMYFADGYGFVKEYVPVQKNPGTGKKEVGSESLLVSRNF